MAFTLATYNLAADRQPQATALAAYRRLLRQARVVVTQEPEVLARNGTLRALPGVVAPLPAMPELDRRPILYKPGRGDTRMAFGGAGVHELERWPLKGWHARRLIPWLILTDPHTHQRFLIINVHLLHAAPAGSARDRANDLIVEGMIHVADKEGLPTVALGDFNRRPGHQGNNALEVRGFTLHSPGGTHGPRQVPIDYAAVRGLDVLDAEVLTGYPGDHDPVLYRLRAPR